MPLRDLCKAPKYLPLSTESTVNFMKSKFEFFYFSFVAMILEWFLYFKIARKTGCLTFSKF